MAWRVTVTADFDDEDTAIKAMEGMEEAASKRDGDIQAYEYEDLDPDPVRVEREHGSMTVGERNPGLADRRF